MSRPESPPYSPAPSTPSPAPDSPHPAPIKILASLPIPGSIYGPSASSGPPKKSHARKQPPGHIPRPRNAFILFRCDFVHQKKVPDHVEHDHRNISRIAGRIWRQMSDADKAPWVAMAEKEKEKHSQLFPGYRYGPVVSGIAGQARRRRRRVDPKKAGEGPSQPPPLPPPPIQPPPRRSSSCPPPGSVPVSPTSGIFNANGAPLTTRDDLSRRPSRVTMYQSAMSGAVLVQPGNSSAPFVQSFSFPWATGPRSPQLVPNSYGVVHPPTGLPGWDAAPPEAYEWLGPDEDSDASMGIDDLHSVFGFVGLDWATLSYASNIPEQIRSENDKPPTFTNPFSGSFPLRPDSFSLFSRTPVYTPRDPQSTPHLSPSQPTEALPDFINPPLPSPHDPFSLHPGPDALHYPATQDLGSDLGSLFPRLSLDDTDIAHVAEWGLFEGGG